jgi:hypothetical protein
MIKGFQRSEAWHIVGIRGLRWEGRGGEGRGGRKGRWRIVSFVPDGFARL